MANLVPVSSFDDVYQIETTDVVLGGPGEIANSQAQALANRTLYLKERVDKSQKVFYSDNMSVTLNSTNPCVKLFEYKPEIHLIDRPLIANLRFKILIKNVTDSINKVFDFELNVNDVDSSFGDDINFRLKLNKYYGGGYFNIPFYLIVKRTRPVNDSEYEIYLERDDTSSDNFNIQIACLDDFTDIYPSFLGNYYSIEDAVYFESSLTAIPSIKNVSSGSNYLTSIFFQPDILDNTFASIVSQRSSSSKTPSSWNNDYFIGGSTQNIIWSGSKSVQLTTTNTAFKIFSYKYKQTSVNLTDVRFDKVLKFDVHYGCEATAGYINVQRSFEFLHVGTRWYLKFYDLRYQQTPYAGGNSPLDIYLIVKERLDADGYTYYDFYIDDNVVNTTITKDVNVFVYDDYGHYFRDKIQFNDLISIEKISNIASDTKATSLKCDDIVYDDVLTNNYISGHMIVGHNPSIANPISIIGESRISDIETQLSNMGSSLPIGSLTMFAGVGAGAPTGWLECNGQELLSVEYPVLSSVLGTAWGSAAAGYFRLPDFRGLFPVGAGTNDKTITGISDSKGNNYVGGDVGTYDTDKLQGHDHITGTTIEGAGGIALPAGSNGAIVTTKGIISDIAGLYGTVRPSHVTKPASAAVKFIIKAL